ncbi:MAG: tetratricopeptide repeat protein [Verrucomicrobiota bacterium]
MPPEQQNLLKILDQQAQSHLDGGEMKSALRLSLAAVETARRAVESESHNLPYLVRALKRLAVLRLANDQDAAAESHYQEALDLAEGEAGVDPMEVALIRAELGNIYDQRGDWKRAVPLFRGAIETIDSNGGTHREVAAGLRNNLGMILKREGEFPEAEQHYKKALSTFSEIYGKESEEVAAVYNNLGGLHYAGGRMKEALEMHQEAYALRESIASGAIEVGQSLCNLAAAYHELNDFVKADEHYRKALDLLRDHLEFDSEVYAITSDNYVSLLRENKQEIKAKKIEKNSASLLDRHHRGRRDAVQKELTLSN